MKSATTFAVLPLLFSTITVASTQSAIGDYLQLRDPAELSSLTPAQCAKESDKLTESMCRSAVALYAIENGEFDMGVEQVALALDRINVVHVQNLPVLWEKHFSPKALAEFKASALAADDSEVQRKYEECMKQQMEARIQSNGEAKLMPSEDALKQQQNQMMQKLLEMNEKFDVSAYMQMSDAEKAKEDEKIRYQTNRMIAEIQSGVSDESKQAMGNQLTITRDCFASSGVGQHIADTINTPFAQYKEQYLALSETDKQSFKRRWLAGDVIKLETLNKQNANAFDPSLTALGTASAMPFLLKMNAGGALPYQPLHMHLQDASNNLSNGNADDSLTNLQNALTVGASLLFAAPTQQNERPINPASYHDIRQQLTLMKATMRKSMGSQLASNPAAAAIMAQVGMFRSLDSLQSDLATLQASAGNDYLPTAALHNFMLIAAGDSAKALSSLDALADQFSNHPNIREVEAETLWYAVAFDMMVKNAPTQVESIPVKTLVARSASKDNVRLITEAYEIARKTDNQSLIEITGTLLTLCKVSIDQARSLPSELNQKAAAFKKAISQGQRQQMIFFTSALGPTLEVQPLAYLAL